MTENEVAREKLWQDVLRRSREAQERLQEHMENLRAGRSTPSASNSIMQDIEQRFRESEDETPVD